MGIDLGREGSGKRFYNLKLNMAQLLSQEVAILLTVALMHIQMHSQITVSAKRVSPQFFSFFLLSTQIATLAPALSKVQQSPLLS